MKIEYKLTGAGWAAGKLITSSNTVEFEVSYFTDCLGDLINEIISLVNTYGEEAEEINVEKNTKKIIKNNKRSFYWTGEPWGYKWQLELEDNLFLKIIFKSYEDYQDEETIEKESIIETEVFLETFIKEIIETLEFILKEYGLEGYKNRWITHEFPIGNYLKLKRLISENKINQATLSEKIDYENLSHEEIHKHVLGYTNVLDELKVLNGLNK